MKCVRELLPLNGFGARSREMQSTLCVEFFFASFADASSLYEYSSVDYGDAVPLLLTGTAVACSRSLSLSIRETRISIRCDTWPVPNKRSSCFSSI